MVLIPIPCFLKLNLLVSANYYMLKSLTAPMILYIVKAEVDILQYLTVFHYVPGPA